MKEFLEKLLQARKEQRDTLNASIIESETKEERAAIGETLKALGEEIAEIEKKLAEVDEPAEEAPANEASAEENNNDERGLNVMATLEMRNGAPAVNDNKEIEARAKAFAETEKMTIGATEARAMLVESGKIATPTMVSGINELNNEVSSIIDMVDVENCEGMGSDKVAYEFTAPEAGVTSEGEAYHEGETVTDYVELKPTTITTISDISRQVRKQSPILYEAKVRKNALIALRKKASELVMTNILASELNVQLALSAIDDKTLRNIALNYGGDENVIGQAVLFLNKKDLIKFGDQRGSDKKPVYEITPDASNPNVGTIKDGGLTVKYCIHSKLAEGKLVYGQPAKAKLDLFGNYEITVSEDFKFNKGLITIRGNVDLDCDVVYKDGFVVATVGA